jgi:PAS domain-containing protein
MVEQTRSVSDRLQNLFHEVTMADNIVHGADGPGTPQRSRAERVAERPAVEAVISLDATGRFIGANRSALQLFGVSLAELRASSPDRFAIVPTIDSEQAALRAEWESAGSWPLVGTAGLKRADGTMIRISYAIETDRSGFRARLWQVEGSPEAPPSVFTVGGVLREWRAAERDLAELVPGTPEWRHILGEIELLRDRYQELFKSVKPGV